MLDCNFAICEDLLVRIIARKAINEAIKAHAEWAPSLRSWYKITKAAQWSSFQDVKNTFSTASNVGTCIVFNIGGNKCRLISYIRFTAKKVYILHILSHADYDKEGWKDDCDCN